jgi:hypothetical protein
VPDDDGKLKVAGEIVALSPQHIAIVRHDPRDGEAIALSTRRVPGGSCLGRVTRTRNELASLEPSVKSAM